MRIANRSDGENAHRYRPLTYRNSRDRVFPPHALIQLGLPQFSPNRLRVCAVSYLNTAPLVWGMLHGPQRGIFDLEFRIPAGCADQLASGAADVGIVPSFELTR